MEYQKEINLLDNTKNHLSKFMTKNVLKQMVTHVECVTPIIKLKT